LFHLVFESPWWKGLGAESEEKREPVSDIDTGVVVSLKVLDPDGRLEKRTNKRSFRYVHFAPLSTRPTKNPRVEIEANREWRHAFRCPPSRAWFKPSASDV
jgi:hypothetical protein